jgi:hypothetical protein
VVTSADWWRCLDRWCNLDTLKDKPDEQRIVGWAGNERDAREGLVHAKLHKLSIVLPIDVSDFATSVAPSCTLVKHSLGTAFML